jgi:hypothetical protein
MERESETSPKMTRRELGKLALYLTAATVGYGATVFGIGKGLELIADQLDIPGRCDKLPEGKEREICLKKKEIRPGDLKLWP